MTEGLAALLDPDFELLSAFAPYASRLLGGHTTDPAGSLDDATGTPRVP